jgi:hypothetical protein
MNSPRHSTWPARRRRLTVAGALTCTDGEGLAVAQVAAGSWIHWLIEPPETDQPITPKHRGRPRA